MFSGILQRCYQQRVKPLNFTKVLQKCAHNSWAVKKNLISRAVENTPYKNKKETNKQANIRRQPTSTEWPVLYKKYIL